MGWNIEKNGGRLFRRPKLTLSCSAEGKEGWEEVKRSKSHTRLHGVIAYKANI
jgi:hypothetical protein